jgi:hypothetical protein
MCCFERRMKLGTPLGFSGIQPGGQAAQARFLDFFEPAQGTGAPSRPKSGRHDAAGHGISVVGGFIFPVLSLPLLPALMSLLLELFRAVLAGVVGPVSFFSP